MYSFLSSDTANNEEDMEQGHIPCNSQELDHGCVDDQGENVQEEEELIQNLPTDVDNSYSDDDMSFSSDLSVGTDIVSEDGSYSSDEHDDGRAENEDNSTKTNDPPLYVIPPQQHLYKSSVTKSEHLLAASALATRHNLSQTAMSDILDFIQLHIPDENIGETSVAKLKDECGFGPNQLQYHLYCDGCKKGFNGNEDNCQTPECQGSKTNPEFNKYFVTSKLEEQLKDIFERPGIWELIKQSNGHNLQSDIISDIKSGLGYQKLQHPGGFLHMSSNITLTLFTDGIPLFSSSSVSLWPVYLLINELSPKERFQRTNMVLWGIWQGVGKPKMCMLLRHLVLDLLILYNYGVTFTVEGQTITSKAMLVVATMDLQARSYVLNMTQHNGVNGCLYCKEPGVVVSSGKGTCRSYPYNKTPVMRSESDARNSAKAARISGQRVEGFFGENVLMYLPYFCMTTNVTIDYMHGALLGVCKKLLQLWFDSKNKTEPWYIGEKIRIMDNMLKEIKPPYFIHRRPRILSNTYSH